MGYSFFDLLQAAAHSKFHSRASLPSSNSSRRRRSKLLDICYMRPSKDQNLGRGGDRTGIAAMAVAGEEDDVGGHRDKRLKMEAEAEEAPLLPGLPDDLAQLCLCRLPATLLYSLSRSWRRVLYSPTFPPFLSLYALLSPSQENHRHSPPELGFYAYDPLSTTWEALPSLGHRPNITHRHPAFINRPLPVQSVALCGKLLLLAASDADLLPALPRPLVFHPAAGRWRLGPPFPAPRRWCACGALGGAVYVVSGVGAEYRSAVARSVDRWDVAGSSEEWEPAAALRDGRFSRDAVEAVGCRGRLCVVNVKGSAAKEGAVYDAGAGRWEEMPKGMLGGWTGPVAAMGEEVMYVVDERTGQLRAYDWEADCWEAVMQSELLVGAGGIAAEGGRVCAVEAGGRGIAVADVGKAAAGKVWRVEAPAGMEVVNVHVLPRVSRPDWYCPC